MTIMQGNRDVTDEVCERARQLALDEKRRTGNFREPVAYLIQARAALNASPRPWMNDCISDSIDAIDKIIEDLHK